MCLYCFILLIQMYIQCFQFINFLLKGVFNFKFSWNIRMDCFIFSFVWGWCNIFTYSSSFQRFYIVINLLLRKINLWSSSKWNGNWWWHRWWWNCWWISDDETLGSISSFSKSKNYGDYWGCSCTILLSLSLLLMVDDGLDGDLVVKHCFLTFLFFVSLALFSF